jgi:hypothetical protein
MKRKPWTLDECVADARRFRTRQEWYANSSGAYQAARNKEWLDQCFKHMDEVRKPKGYWTRETCVASAKKHKTRSEWHYAESSAYHKAKENGWLEECTAHMPILKKHHTKDDCLTAAKKFETRIEWYQGDNKTYRAAYMNKWLPECCEHMTSKYKPKGYWTKERCIAEASQYELLNDWMLCGGGSFWVARRNGWLDECTAHLTKYYRLSKLEKDVI